MRVNENTSCRHVCTKFRTIAATCITGRSDMNDASGYFIFQQRARSSFVYFWNYTLQLSSRELAWNWPMVKMRVVIIWRNSGWLTESSQHDVIVRTFCDDVRLLFFVGKMSRRWKIERLRLYFRRYEVVITRSSWNNRNYSATCVCKMQRRGVIHLDT